MINWARSVAKPFVFAALGSGPVIAHKLRAIRATDVVTILNLHRVAPPDGSTYPPLSPSLFEQLLRFVRQHFEVVTLAELASEQSGGRPRLVISFDDGYADFATHAAPLLEKHGIRVNQNIIPECVETGLPPLNVILQDFAGRAPLDALRNLQVPGLAVDPARMGRKAYGSRLSVHFRQQPAKIQKQLSEAILPQIRRVKGFAPTAMMTMDQVRRLSSRHEFGAHSFAHASMAAETDEYVSADVSRCKQWFENNLDQKVTIYAFPNGSFRPSQVQIVRDGGIDCILLVEGDFSTAGTSVHKRFNFDAVSQAEMRFRATGGFRWPRRPN